MLVSNIDFNQYPVANQDLWYLHSTDSVVQWHPALTLESHHHHHRRRRHFIYSSKNQSYRKTVSVKQLEPDSKAQLGPLTAALE